MSKLSELTVHMPFKEIAEMILSSDTVHISKHSVDDLRNTSDDHSSLHAVFCHNEDTIANLVISIKSTITQNKDNSIWKTTFTKFDLTIQGMSLSDNYEEYSSQIKYICNLVQTLKDTFSIIPISTCIKTAEMIGVESEHNQLRNEYKQFIENAFLKARVGKIVKHNLVPHPDLKDDKVKLQFPYNGGWRVFSVDKHYIEYSERLAN